MSEKVGVVITGGDRVKTDAGGNYTSPFTGLGISTYFNGPNFEVFNNDELEAEHYDSSPGNPDNFAWSFADDDTHMDELNVFYHLNNVFLWHLLSGVQCLVFC